MRWLDKARSVWFLVAAGLVGGGLAGAATIPIVSSALAQAVTGPGAELDVTHLPPLLTLTGESLPLVFDAHCAAPGTEDPEAGCAVEGRLFGRVPGDSAFRELPLTSVGAADGQWVGHVPAAARRARSIAYYAEFSSPDTGATVTVPPGGAAAPYVTRMLVGAAHVRLGRHVFGASALPGERVASARWGDGPTEVGLEQGRGLDPIGASSFDVDEDGSVVVLDHAHRRLLRWIGRSLTPSRVPLSVNGAIADLALAGDGTLYVLETTSRDERAPLLRRFDAEGRELEAIETAERSPSGLRMGPAGPLVLQRPSHQWMPGFVAGMPAQPGVQRKRGRMGRTLPSGEEVVVYRHANELRVAVLGGDAPARSWRITSETTLGEVQLAELVGTRLVVVVRTYDERDDEFAVLLLDRDGLVAKHTLASAEWADGAPLGRFRIAGRSLYRLGSSPTGVFVDRFDLEVHR